MKSIRIKVFVEPWEELTEEDCADPNGFETEIRITEEDIQDACDFMGLRSDGKIHMDDIMDSIQETIDEKIMDLVPTEYSGDYTWEYVGNDYEKVEEFAKPILQEKETELVRERYEHYFQSWTHAEFVEEKNVDGIDYAYYRVRKDQIM